MTPEKKRKLRNIALLALLGLIGGTFAFQSFNQQAINDREMTNQTAVGGRVHDYFNREEENKDVFVGNFGQEPIMVRLRLSEFMEVRERGIDDWRQLVDDTSRENTQGWPYYIPEPDNLKQRTGVGAAFNSYSELTFGWEGNGTAPWYLPTFNMVYDDDRTAAAGDARDYEADGTTHPGNGKSDQWGEGGSYDNSNNNYPGAGVTRHTTQTLPQDLTPMTLQEWQGTNQVGNFWVIDHETGWAYWANQLNGGQATSYLLDAAEMLPDADNINGSYYYAIHVESDLISVSEEFQEEPATGAVSDLLEEIRERGTGNPAPTTVAHTRAFNFNRMSDAIGENRHFTLANSDGTDAQMFRYLENQGSGNHMIIRNETIRSVSWVEQERQEGRLETWFNSEIPADLREVVQPVADPFTTGMVVDNSVTFTGGARWLPNNLIGDVAADETVVVPSGRARAFALSLADVARLSGIGLGFPNHAQRGSHDLGWWWLRTPSTDTGAWFVTLEGQLNGARTSMLYLTDEGVRPALIIHQ